MAQPAFDTLDGLCVNTIRTLAMDAVQKANSGHPGAPMGLAPVAYVLWNRFLNYDPKFPYWTNRDRFVLSNGHASMLIYSLVHLAGVVDRDEHGKPVDKPSLMVLHALSLGEPMRLSDVAIAVCLDLSTVSRHVRALQEGGYVRRTEDPHDRRASLLALTDEGHAVLARSFEVRRTAIGHAIAGWSEEDRQTLTHLLTRLASDLAPRIAAPAPTER